MDKPSIQVLASADAVANAAAERIIDAANAAISGRGRFSIALGAGETSARLYELLSSDQISRRINWPRWDIYFTEERCIPPAQSGSSFRLVSETLLDLAPVQRENIHRIKGEIEPLQAAIEYGRMLKEKFGDGGPDLVLLELGERGQIAGLFPQTAALGETHHRCAENFVEILNQWRVTITAPFINRAGLVIVLATGQDKAADVALALEGERRPQGSPAQLIDPAEGELQWILDAGAAGMNEED